jgi:dTDP-4-dehydrorhamnose reductase
MRILITGKNGQVGYELERSLQGLGEIIALDRTQLDLGDSNKIRQTIRDIKPNLIINPAAYTAVDKAESEPEIAMQINGIAPGIMADEAVKIGSAIIHYSTDYVFDGNSARPYLEDDTPNPINVYGRTKLAGEQAVQASGAPYLIFRTSWVYAMRGQNFLLTIKRLAKERDALRIIDDQHGAPTWARTIADTTAHIVAKSSSQSGLIHKQETWSNIYHLTAQGHTTWYGFANEVLSNAELEKIPTLTAIPTAEYPTAALRPLNSRLCSDKLITNFCNLPHWSQALKLCMS